MPATVSAAELQMMVAEEGAQVVEVLPEKEYEEEHIAGAVHLPLKRLNPDSCERLDRTRPVIVYCWDSL